MSVSQKQTLEIVMVLYREQTYSFLTNLLQCLLRRKRRSSLVIRNMKNHGKSIVIITHKLHELWRFRTG